MTAVPKGPTDTCYNCRAEDHEKCDKLKTTLCACNHRDHEEISPNSIDSE